MITILEVMKLKEKSLDKIKKDFLLSTESMEAVGLGCTVNFDSKKLTSLPLNILFTLAKIFTERNWKIILSELIVLAKQQGLHTMIGVIDAETKAVSIFMKIWFQTVGIIKMLPII
jgi:phosphinothricin acetyltransferase